MQVAEDQKKHGKKRPLKESGDFVCFRQYSNSLPNAPSGPFFKPRTSHTSYEKYANYEVSTLEKSFIWQPHFGLDIGINLDLVDQDEVLKFSVNDPRDLDPADQKFIQGVDRNRKKVRGIESFGEKPWWLRNTTYSENNLFKVTTREQTAVKRKIATERIAINPLSIGAIESSFTDVTSTIKTKLLNDKDDSKSIEWCIDFFPDDHISGDVFSLVRFDEDPQKIVDARNKADGNSRTLSKAVVANTRKSTNTETRNAIYCSLVAGNDDSSNETTSSVATAAAARYDWVSDFKMDVKAGEIDDFLVVLTHGVSNDGTSSSPTPSVHYIPLHSRVELRKLAGQDSEPHDSLISRRPNRDN